MSQSSIRDYYSTSKRRPDQFVKDVKVLVNSTELSNEILNGADESPFKVPTTPVLKSKRSTLIKEREIKSESTHLNNKKASRTTLSDDGQESILKWTKRTINFNESSSEKKKKRVEVASKEDEQTADQTTNPNHEQFKPSLSPTKTTIKKRLFGSELDKIREKILISDETFLNKLKDFKEKTASPIKLQINNLNSPTKRMKEREERREKAKELIELSPKKFLREKLSSSPLKSPIKSRILDGLNLPSKYKLLIHNFHCLDSVVAMLFNRLETCTFDKIKSGIQKITKKNFDLSHIAQILTIYPNSYTLSYEKKTAVDNLNNLKVLTKQSPFYLVLTPKLSAIKMTPSMLKCRRDEFETRLNQYARKVHNDYLLSLDPPVIIKDEELTRWHPSFLFPNVREATLPEQPISINESKSLNDFWADKLNIEPQSKPKIDLKSSNKNQSGKKITKGVLKGLSQDLLDRVSFCVHHIYV